MLPGRGFRGCCRMLWRRAASTVPPRCHRMSIGRANVRSAEPTLHCCKQCAHFEPSTRFQCLKPIPARIAVKDQANECELFSPRVTVARDAAPGGNNNISSQLRKKLRDLPPTPGPPSTVSSRSRNSFQSTAQAGSLLTAEKNPARWLDRLSVPSASPRRPESHAAAGTRWFEILPAVSGEWSARSRGGRRIR